MIPLRDSNPSQTVPAVNITLILLNAMIFVYQVSLGPFEERFLVEYGLIPLRFVNALAYEDGVFGKALVPLFVSMFMHGGWFHLLGNVWFLWIFGDNVEDRLGHGRYFLFYLLCGIGASLIQVIWHPASRLPMIGASGAISGVLGAYLVCFPHARVLTLLFIWLVEVPAFLLLGVWFLLQLKAGTSLIGIEHDVGGVAFWAHIGGFVVGILLVLIMRKRPGHRDLSRY